MRSIRRWIVLILFGLLLNGCAGTQVIWDAWGPKEPQNCLAKAFWTIERYPGDGPCLVVYGIASDIRHAEFWEWEDRKGLPSPFGNSLLIYKGSTIYFVEQYQCGTKRREIKLTNKQSDAYLWMCKERKDK